MARLPTPGSDDGTWGNILNDFLAQSHNGDGTLKDGIVTPSKLSFDPATQAELEGVAQAKLASGTNPLETQTQQISFGSSPQDVVVNQGIDSTAVALATGLEGDAFPRLIIGADPGTGIFTGDGTADLTDGSHLNIYFGNDDMNVDAPGGLTVSRGDIKVSTSTKGAVLKSPNNSLRRLRVNNNGTLLTENTDGSNPLIIGVSRSSSRLEIRSSGAAGGYPSGSNDFPLVVDPINASNNGSVTAIYKLSNNSSIGANIAAVGVTTAELVYADLTVTNLSDGSTITIAHDGSPQSLSVSNNGSNTLTAIEFDSEDNAGSGGLTFVSGPNSHVAVANAGIYSVTVFAQIATT